MGNSNFTLKNVHSLGGKFTSWAGGGGGEFRAQNTWPVKCQIKSDFDCPNSWIALNRETQISLSFTISKLGIYL